MCDGMEEAMENRENLKMVRCCHGHYHSIIPHPFTAGQPQEPEEEKGT